MKGDCSKRPLTDIADPQAAEMAKKGCIRYECTDEDKCQKWSSPRWYPTCANTFIRMSAQASVKKDESCRTQSTDLP